MTHPSHSIPEDHLTTKFCAEIRQKIETSFPQLPAPSPGLRNASIRINRIIERFKRRSGRLPAESEIAQALGMSTTTYQNLLLFLLRAKAISLKAPEAFIESLLSLPKYQIQVLSLFYLDGLSEEKIADRLGTSVQRIAITHASALHYLSKPFTLVNTAARC